MNVENVRHSGADCFQVRCLPWSRIGRSHDCTHTHPHHSFDTIRGNNADNILVGNAGNDLLQGRAGRDILIGGLGADTLDGGDGDDVLIGGKTNNDALITNLNAIRTEWTSANLYATRIANLRAGVGSPVVSLKAKVNVLNDSTSGAVDSLVGGNGEDWFFKAVDDVITDLFAEESLDLL